MASCLAAAAGEPVLGIGLDNFRLRYGEVLGFNQWNESIHANNWYIETVVSVGLAGAVPFFLWLGLLVWEMAVGIRERPAQLWLAAVAAGLLAYLFHGLLDYFLLFNSTGLLFWILVGLWLRLAHAGVASLSGR
jgi:O-antigen ligase